MAEIHIKRLALQMPGTSERDGQRLAQMIVEGLASATIAAEAPQHIDALHVQATAGPGNTIDMLSQQIVAEIVRQLESTL